MNVVNIIRNTSWVRFKRFLKLFFGPKYIRLMNKQMKLSLERCRKYQKIEQDHCPHLAGCNKLSNRTLDYSSIVWHHIDPDTWWGVCTVCQRQFWPSDSDYSLWRNKRSFNRPSGIFKGVNPPPYPGDNLSHEQYFKNQICLLDVECGLIFDPEKKLTNDDGDDPDNWSDEKLKNTLDEAYKLAQQNRSSVQKVN